VGRYRRDSTGRGRRVNRVSAGSGGGAAQSTSASWTLKATRMASPHRRAARINRRVLMGRCQATGNRGSASNVSPGMTEHGTGRAGAIRLAAGLIVVAGLAGACGGGGDTDGSSAASDAGGEATEVDSATSGDGDSADEAAGGAAEGESAAGGSSALDLVAAQRDVVRTGSVRVTVERVTEAGAEVRAIAEDVGGFVADEQVQAADGTVSVTVRVPSDSYQDVLAAVGELGDVSEQDVQATDVTAEVVDLESRIASLRASVDRVRALLGEAGSVDQLAVVEGELTGRETELEALLGQQRVLADQVALGTLTVHLSEDEPPAPAEGAAGFADGLRRGWVAFVDGGRLLLAVTGFLLPFAAIAVPVGLAVRWWMRRRQPAPAAAEGGA
jgi:hypothetical protein